MMEKEIDLTPKQAVAWLKLTDETTTEIGYGGAGGGGKSILGCLWIIIMCIKYPGVHYFIGRKELVNLKRTTLISFFEVVQILGYKNDELFGINWQNNIVTFHNGSKIFLLDMAYKPTDPLYTRFGGLLLTGGFIDESAETEYKAIDIIRTRLGRWKNKEYGLRPKLLEAFNPAKNHVYQRFYKPWKEKSLPAHKVFIKALPTDNPHLSPDYLEQLKNSDEVTKQRLLYGNFEYDDDPSCLVGYEAILDLFTNEHVEAAYEKYISSDIAMQGRDLFVITSWEGLRCKIPVVKEKSTGKEVIEDIKRISIEKSIPRSHIVCDSDGLGSYIEGFLNNIKTFHGGAKPRNTKEFRNLKAECAFKLAELINKREIFIECDDLVLRNKIIQELEQLKRDNVDKDEVKKSIISKELMKENIGRSPDFLDCLLMRMIFEISASYTPSIA